MNIEKLNPGACWTYLLTNDDNTCVLIDPVIIHTEEYLKLLSDRKLKLTHVVDTHTHADHISAGASLVQATGCEYVMHEKAPAKCVTTHVREGDIIEIAGKKARVLETPGHTRDSISLLFDDMIFTGDFLFLEDAGAGRDDLPGGDATAHWESLQRLDDVSGDVMVYPAHEYRSRVPSNLDNQREKNPHLRIKSKNDFVTYINDLKLGPADWMKDVLKANYSCSTDPDAAFIPTDVPACEVKGTMASDVADIQVEYIDKYALESLNSPVLLDVREPEELDDALGHIDGVINIPVGQLSKRLDEIIPYKDKTIVSICRSGARATTAAQILSSQGFEKVKVLEGGMIGYRS
ncbi:MAG: MBL fold metallo-hydrolase [Eubacteriales bacterium]